MQPVERKARIAGFFNERGFHIDSGTDLFESGAIDSMGVVELAMFLEEELNIRLDAEKMTAENFRTLEAIFELVEKADA